MSHLPEPNQQDATKAASTMKTVLLVDDDPETIEAWTLCMQSEECKVLSAFDGNSALALLGENLVDIVISDWKMPGLGGALLCQTMKTNSATAHIPFLMISGHPHPAGFRSLRWLSAKACRG